MRNVGHRYILENAVEGERLERQGRLDHYKVENELAEVPVKDGDVILDAGCGTGVVTRFLAGRWPNARVEGCDFSSSRISEAAKLSGPAIRYFHSDLKSLNIPADHYDGVTSRLVFEHLEDPQEVAQELYRIIKPGGWAYIVDIDGLVFNLSPLSNKLRMMIDAIKNRLPVDLYVGSKLVSYLRKAGFKDVSSQIDVINLTGENATIEREMNLQRITQSMPSLISAFGNQALAEDFFSTYSTESERPDTTFKFLKMKVIGYKNKSSSF